MNIGEKVRELRTRKGFSQEVVADLLGISQTAYSNIANNKTPNISLNRLEQIANVLEISIFELLSIGESNVLYFNTTQGGQAGYILNNPVSNYYESEQVKLLKLENEELKKEIKLLNEKLDSLLIIVQKANY